MRVSILTTTIWCTVYGLGAAQSLPPATPAPVDSMAYYNNTKKPVIGNPSFIEYAPTIQADGKTIIYQRNDGKKYNLYITNLENGVWGEGKSIEKINASGDSTGLVGGPSLSFDGNTLYFFRSLDRGNHDIFYSQRNKDGWGEPINIGAPINLEPTVNKDKETVGGYDGFPSVSADGKTLYFVRQNLEGPRDKDLKKQRSFCTCIFKSEKENGTWSKPEKLPWPINQECEKGPRIMADGKTLIFSSNRPGGKGGYDMYQSKLNELGEWDMPVPLNFVNTEKDDQLPCISAQGDVMYYTYNNADIYSVVIPPKLRQFMNNVVQGFITDLDGGNGIGATVTVTDALTSEVVVQLENNPSDGRYTLVLPVGRNFNLEFKKEGYSSFTQALDLSAAQKYEERSLDVKLFRKVKLMLTVSDKELFEPILADVKIKQKGQGVFISETKNNPKDGSLVGDLPLGSEYEIIISAPHFKSTILNFDVSGLVIYRTFEKYVELVPEKVDVMVNVSDLVNNAKVKAKVVLKNKNRDEVIEVTGNQMVSLRSGDRYEMEVTSDQGYAFSSGVVDGSTPIEVKLLKLEQNAKLTLRDINFESNSVKLSDISFTELNRVVQLMKENPTLKVEVAAHTDDVGLDVYNLELSDKRAKSVADFLLENKISADRFVAKGYGESQSKVPNDSDANRAINRRVELKIISI
jgi:outer membrane protein OmpA-like peptidoglycan-associated protein/Tol biopolymer transport system component